MKGVRWKSQQHNTRRTTQLHRLQRTMRDIVIEYEQHWLILCASGVPHKEWQVLSNKYVEIHVATRRSNIVGTRRGTIWERVLHSNLRKDKEWRYVSTGGMNSTAKSD